MANAGCLATDFNRSGHTVSFVAICVEALGFLTSYPIKDVGRIKTVKTTPQNRVHDES